MYSGMVVEIASRDSSRKDLKDGYELIHPYSRRLISSVEYFEARENEVNRDLQISESVSESSQDSLEGTGCRCFDLCKQLGLSEEKLKKCRIEFPLLASKKSTKNMVACHYVE